LVLTLNDDLFLSGNYLDEMIRVIHANQEGIMLGAISIDYETKQQITFAKTKMEQKWNGSYIPRVKYGSLYDVSIFKGIKKTLVLPIRGLIFSIRIFELLNGFDETFPQYASDYDLY
jgi:GT2 family glycosyltransferase